MKLQESLFSLFQPQPPDGGTGAPKALARAVVGWVFLASGIIKFLFENQGEGRFAKIGFSNPEALAYFVGGVEIVAGTLVVLGLFTRVAVIPLIVDMIVAVATTKLPLLFGAGPEPVAAMPKIGFWAFAYQSRLDLAMFACCTYLLGSGAGLWSLDALLAQRKSGKLQSAGHESRPVVA